MVTNPTNLYTQDDFKSRDVVLTFHLGLAMRVASQYRQPINELPAMLLDEPCLMRLGHSRALESISANSREGRLSRIGLPPGVPRCGKR